jgi:hypothetical protein
MVDACFAAVREAHASLLDALLQPYRADPRAGALPGAAPLPAPPAQEMPGPAPARGRGKAGRSRHETAPGKRAGRKGQPPAGKL